jgi:uncharacterized protein (DUF342 family)
VAVIAKGGAILAVNQDETEARLVFTPDPQGMEWDVEAVLRLGRDSGLSSLPAPADLERFIQRAGGAREVSLEFPLARGIPPEPAVPERVAWETLTVPDDAAPFKEEALSKAGPPALFRVRVERARRNTPGKRRGKFPFMAARNETAAVWDEREIREPARVNPEVREIRYAERDQKLGRFEAAGPGKPGKSVYGRSLPPPVLEDPAFYLGAGIRKERDELFAQYPGFVRIGGNWADLVPLAKPGWKFVPGPDRITLYLTFYPGDSRFAPPSGEEIRAQAQKQGAGLEGLVGAEEIDAAIAASTKTGEVLTAFPLMKVQEGEVRVEVSPDLLKAELVLQKGIAGGRPLEMAAISRVVTNSRVQGINAEKLKKTIHAFMEGNSTVLRCILAEGRAATRGPGREVNLLVRPLEAELRTVLLKRLIGLKTLPDFHQGFPCSDAEQLCVVRKGTRLAQITKPPNGEQGKDVYGNLIPGLPGSDPELKLFRGLYQGGDYINAGRDGLLLVKGKGKVFWGTIVDYRDSRITVHVSENAMEASVELVSELGPGLPLTEEKIYRALAEAGVTRGISQEAVRTARKMAVLAGSSIQVLARGKTPVAAGGQEITWLEPLSTPGIKRAVTAGAPLAELRRVAADKTGFDVRGNELKPAAISAESGGVDDLDGTTGELRWDKTVLATETAPGVQKLLAAQSGEPRFDGGILSISGLKEVKGDVSASMGRINFSGALRISGKVRHGCRILGGKDVFIAGSVEGALISSGGKVVIVQGIKGAGQGVVRAKATIDTDYAESATLLAVDDIRLINHCVSCSVKTNGRVFLSSARGRLVGGICWARRGISAAELGGENGEPTEVSFGQDYLIKDQIEALEREVKKILAILAKVEEVIKDSENKPAQLEAARTEKARLLKLREQYPLKLFTLREKFEEHYESEVTVTGAVHQGVVIESHGRYYEISKKRRGAVFFFDKETGRIMEKRL